MRKEVLVFLLSSMATVFCVMAMNPEKDQVVLRAHGPHRLRRKENRHAVHSLHENDDTKPNALEPESRAPVVDSRNQQRIMHLMKAFNYYVVTHAKRSKAAWSSTDKEPGCFWAVDDNLVKELVDMKQEIAKLSFMSIAYSPANPFRLTIAFAEASTETEFRLQEGLLKLSCPTLADSADLRNLIFGVAAVNEAFNFAAPNYAQWMGKNTLELNRETGDMSVRLAAEYSLDHREEVIPVLNLHSVMKSFLEEANLKLENKPWTIKAESNYRQIEKPPQFFVFSDTATKAKTKVPGDFLFESAKDASMIANNLLFHLGSHTFPFHPNSPLFGPIVSKKEKSLSLNTKKEHLESWLQAVHKKGLLTVMPCDVTIIRNLKKTEKKTEEKTIDCPTLVGIVVRHFPATSYFIVSGLDWIAFPELKIDAKAPKLPEVLRRSPFYMSETGCPCERTALSKCKFLDVEFTIPFNEA